MKTMKVIERLQKRWGNYKNGKETIKVVGR